MENSEVNPASRRPMNLRDIVEELNRITKAITSPDISPLQGVQFAFLALESLKVKLIHDNLQSILAGDDPGFEVMRGESETPGGL